MLSIYIVAQIYPILKHIYKYIYAFQVVQCVKDPPAMQKMQADTSLIPRSGQSPGGGHGNSLQYSCLRNPMVRVAWWTTVCGVAKSQT